MKEVKEWNNKPRWMWVWDVVEECRCKEYVICILTEEQMKECGANYPVKCSNCKGFFHCAEIEEKTKRPCNREELIEMLKKQGLPMIYCKQNDVIYNIIHIEKDIVVLLSPLGGVMPYSYKELCEHYTLIDGTELWVEE